MTSSSAKGVLVCITLLLPVAVAADDWQLSGHLKYQATVSHYDATSLFGSGGGINALDQNANLRLKAEKRNGKWDFRVHYELGALYGHTLEASRSVSPPYGSYGVTNDNNRLFNLTTVIYDEGRAAVAQRLDRASVGYTSGSFVFRAGRDAVSWGNGVVFQPMDIFNPFAPTAIDKEYKTGDDMLYTQWLFNDGSDLQAIAVLRRNNANTLDADSSSLAAKYRTRIAAIDADLLLARHYGENLAGIGVTADWGGAVVRSDVTANAAPGGTTLSGVVNTSYSWMWADHNVSGFAEYFRNGFGQSGGNYNLAAIMANTPLVERLARGELYNIAQDYLASGLTVELTPRWQLSPTLFWNLNDGSALLQFGATHDWKQDVTILLGGIVPVGPQGTEYGGIPLGGGLFYRPAISVYGHVAYYF